MLLMYNCTAKVMSPNVLKKETYQIKQEMPSAALSGVSRCRKNGLGDLSRPHFLDSAPFLDPSG